MLVRIVKMTFLPEEINAFITLFDTYKTEIRSFPGCQYLRILQDQKHAEIIFSYSYWQSEEDLNKYRMSALFKKIWSETKKKFAAKPEAWSTSVLYHLE